MNRKIIAFLAIIAVFYLIIPASLYFFRHQIRDAIFHPKEKVQPKLIREIVPSQNIINEDHPTLFIAKLDFDPKTNTVIQKSITTSRGDLPLLLNSPPATSSAKFVYRVDVRTDKNRQLQAGWSWVYKEMKNKEGRLEFQITTVYEPKAIVRVYLPNDRQIWVGRMP